MKQIVIRFCSIITGSTFFISGFVKLNDIIGFSYKLEEYFEDGALAYRIKNIFNWDAFSLDFLTDYALFFASILCLMEVVLGLNLIFDIFRKASKWLLFALSIVFFFLTLHTATCDPLDTYNHSITIDKSDTHYTELLYQFSNNPNIILDEEASLHTSFTEKKSVQCVNDCGCFGDAMKGSIGRSLTPWESFYKDIILIALLLPILIIRSSKKIVPNLKKELINPIASLIPISGFCFLFSWWLPIILFLGLSLTIILIKQAPVRYIVLKVYSVTLFFLFGVSILTISYFYLPIKDFRPYRVGSNIIEKMSLPEDAKQPVFKDVFLYKHLSSGEVEEFDDTNYPWDNPDYEFVDRTSFLIEAGDEPEIKDFSIIDIKNGADYTQSVLSDSNDVFILISYKIDNSSKFMPNKLNHFYNSVVNNGQTFIGLTSSLPSTIKTFKTSYNLSFDFYNCDEITLKTIIRANPAVIWLRQGTILGKWPINKLPKYEDLD